MTNTGIERRGAAALAALFAVAVPQRVRGDEGGRPTLRVGALPDALQLDGILDEPAWAQAPSIEDLVMVEPGQGQRPTGRTLVKVLASPKALVFGARCEDPDAARIVSFTKERDGDFEAEDHLVIVLDPFQDGRSGYVFAVNPGGARFDGLVQPSGESLDTDWDGEWEAATHRDAAGWSAEIRVPIDTLSFKHGLKEWAFNIQRRLQRLQETDRWASARQDYKFYRTSQAGLLTGLPEFDTGVGLGIRPALVGGFQNPAPGAATDGTLDPSLDVTQRLGSNVLASLTVNTDFAETEVDTGLEVTALHNHFFWDSPKVMFMHIGGSGDEATLAAAVGKVLAKVKETSGGNGHVPRADIDPSRTTLDPTKIEAVIGQKGQLADGVYKVTIGRATQMHGDTMATAMGVNTWAAFAGSDQQAVVDGDFAMRESELQAVLKALRGAGINIVAIHQHMAGDEPRILFLHYWGVGRTADLARGLRAALDQTKPAAR